MIGKRLSIIHLLPCMIAGGQTPYSLVQGIVHDGIGGQPLAGVYVSYFHPGLDVRGGVCSDSKGVFSLPGLSPGPVQLSVRHVGVGCATGARTVETRKWREVDLEVTVASRTDLQIVLWPMSDVWSERVFEGVQFAESRSLAHSYGPDLDTSRPENFNPIPSDSALLDSALSNVTGSRSVRNLPLANRDIHATLVLQPGVTADAGTARGLGVSVTGQRASSANFSVDGVEMNNPLLSGPLLNIAPEAVQEYRYSTNGFAAEYGRAAGLVANAVTRTGGSVWHGLFYLYGKHEALSANEWQRNANGYERQPLRELQPGAVISGPVVNWIFTSFSVEALRFRSAAQYEDLLVPGRAAPAKPKARSYLEGSLLPAYDSATPTTPVPLRLEPRVSLDRRLLLPRIDFVPRHGRSRLFLRLAYSMLNRPDLVWTPYLADRVPFRERASNLAVSYIESLTPALSIELRAAFSSHSYSVERSRPEIPFLYPAYFEGGLDVWLPGSPIAYDFAQRERGVQTTAAISWIRGAHLFKAGLDIVHRNAENLTSTFASGSVAFGSFSDFLQDRPQLSELPVGCQDITRAPCAGPPPDPRRNFTIEEPAWYAQTSLRLTPRLVVHAGFRTEIMGSPRTSKPGTVYQYSGPPLNLAETAGVTAGLPRQPFPSLRAISARTGLAYSWGALRRSTLRFGHGAFQDRLIEGIWFGARRGETALDGPSLISITAFDRRFRPGVAHNSFAALQTVFSEAWSFEATGQIASGRSLPSANLVNRAAKERPVPRSNAFPYIGNQGESFYSALTATVHGRTARSQFQASYTWSHSTDFQSDALQGYFGSVFSNPNRAQEAETGRATFMREFRREGEWGASDFDQRQNVTFLGTWDPRPGWTLAAVLAVRTGFPFTVFAATGSSDDRLRKARARLKTPDREAYQQRVPVPGGWKILDDKQFEPAPEGNEATGRNAFAGPGLFASDVSLSRRWRRFTIRADAFNFFNHANLNRPAATLESSDFGIAKAGRREEETGFPALLPLVESPRRLQILLRYEF